MKYFVNYSGTKESFKDLEEQYYKYIVFIEGSDLIYTHGHYYGDLKEAFEALKVEISDSINLLKEQVNTTDTDLYNNIDSLSNNLADNVDKLAKMITSNTKSIQDQIDVLVNADASIAINTFNEIVSFLEGIENSEDLDSIIANIEQQIANVNKSLEEHLTKSQEIFITRSEVEDNYITKTEVVNNYQIKGDYALKSDLEASIPTKVSQLENDVLYALKSDVEVEVEVEVPNGVYAVTADGELIDYNIADSSCIGVALITDNQRIMIEKNGEANTNIIKAAFDADGATYIDYPKFYWGMYGSDVAGITYISSSDAAKQDFNGKANTTAIIATPDTDSYTTYANMGTYCTKFNEMSGTYADWYVPAAGQLYEIYNNVTNINTALTNIGGTTFSKSYDYWSSSECSFYEAWLVAFNFGNVLKYSKTNGARVRFVRDISVKSLKERVSKLESQMITGDIKSIKKVTALPDNPDPNTLYIITS